jgi:DNA gyrase/topoisomerase IV subunit A
LRSITAVGWNSYRVITPSDEDAEYVKPDRTDTTDTLLVATKDNKLYWLKVDDLLRGSGQNARIKIFGGFVRVYFLFDK